MAAGTLTIVCLLATGCTSATGTTPTAPSGPGAVTTEPAGATGHWQGTFQVDGLLTNGPAHVGSAGCTTIGYVALDLHRAATGPRGRSVSGHLRVWAVTTSGTTATACGRPGSSQGTLLGTVSGDGRHLRAGSFHLLGVTYGWLTATVADAPVGPAAQQMQGRFGAGRGDHRSLRGSFTLARRGNAAASSQSPSRPSPGGDG